MAVCDDDRGADGSLKGGRRHVRAPARRLGHHLGVEVNDLVGAFVVEAGVRQAWPFVGFCDNRLTPSREARLYVDAPWSLNDQRRSASDLDAWWPVAAELNGHTVTSATVAGDGSLRLETADGIALEVSGRGEATTAGEPWWLTAT